MKKFSYGGLACFAAGLILLFSGRYGSGLLVLFLALILSIIAAVKKSKEKSNTPVSSPSPHVSAAKPDYFFDTVDVSVLRGQPINFSEFSVGSKVWFKQEPENEYDHGAVVVMGDGGKIGYLYKGKVQKMVNDWKTAGDALAGKIVSNDGQKIQISVSFWKGEPEADEDEDSEE